MSSVESILMLGTAEFIELDNVNTNLTPGSPLAMALHLLLLLAHIYSIMKQVLLELAQEQLLLLFIQAQTHHLLPLIIILLHVHQLAYHGFTEEQLLMLLIH